MKPIIGITMGDPSGIGPEILVRFAKKLERYNRAKLLIFGDGSYLSKIQSRFYGARRSTFHLPVVGPNLLENQKPVFGHSSAWGGAASGQYIHDAVRAAQKGQVDGLVTMPINKYSFKLGGWGKKYPDHTQMLRALTGSRRTILMLAHKKFRVSHVTQHIPLKNVASYITRESVQETIQLTHEGLRQMGIRHPRLAVCGLNPHAGDQGVMGTEEIRIIEPAVRKSRKNKIKAEGPFSADAVFPRMLAGHFDAAVAMYHDQGQIPMKFYAARFEHQVLDPGGVNLTLGLPFVRTSPAHGTAYDVAGKGKVSGRSFFEALDMAVDMVQSRK